MGIPLSSLDWSLVQAFLAVAETGSLSAAARQLNASQPTLGRQIRAIEKQLGADLFHRRPRGFDLTETGAALVAPARAMRDAVNQIALTAAGQTARLEGSVRITASTTLSAHQLPAIIARIRAAEPRISIDLTPTDSTTNLLFREADIAIRMFRPTQLDLVTLHIGNIALSAFASHSYLQRRGAPHAETILQHDVVGYDQHPGIIDGFRAAGLDVNRDWFKTRCDDNVVYWELVRAGCGIGFAQTNIGRADPGVTEIDFGFPIPSLPVWLTAHAAMRQSPRIRRVWDLLADGLRPLVT